VDCQNIAAGLQRSRGQTRDVDRKILEYHGRSVGVTG
jgi:hypothetical protein